jgi:hypothetical protein
MIGENFRFLFGGHLLWSIRPESEKRFPLPLLNMGKRWGESVFCPTS